MVPWKVNSTLRGQATAILCTYSPGHFFVVSTCSLLSHEARGISFYWNLSKSAKVELKF